MRLAASGSVTSADPIEPSSGIEHAIDAADMADTVDTDWQSDGDARLPGVQNAGLRSRLYGVGWMVAAICAGVYLTTSVAWSDLADRLGGTSGAARSELAAAAQETQRLQSQITALKTASAASTTALAERDRQLAQARRILERERQTRLAMTREMAALKALVAEAGGAPAAKPARAAQPKPIAAAAPAPTTAAETPAPPAATRVASNGRQPPLPVRAPDVRPRFPNNAVSVVNGASQIATGAVPAADPPKPQGRIEPDAADAARAEPAQAVTNAQPTISFGDPIVTAARPSSDVVALKLSRAPSVGSLRLSWQVLNDRHASVLQGLRPRYRTMPNGVGGQAYELLAGPVLSRAEADQLCSLLRVQDVPCSISSFVGAAL
ncbi:MAG: hypothetical protein AAFR55_08220 [Pseudomonadota bacterium]